MFMWILRPTSPAAETYFISKTASGQTCGIWYVNVT